MGTRLTEHQKRKAILRAIRVAKHGDMKDERDEREIPDEEEDFGIYIGEQKEPKEIRLPSGSVITTDAVMAKFDDLIAKLKE